MINLIAQDLTYYLFYDIKIDKPKWSQILIVLSADPEAIMLSLYLKQY